MGVVNSLEGGKLASERERERDGERIGLNEVTTPDAAPATPI